MGSGAMSESEIKAKFMQNVMKREMGLTDNDLAILTMAEKVRSLSFVSFHTAFPFSLVLGLVFLYSKLPTSMGYIYARTLLTQDPFRSQNRILHAYRSHFGPQKGSKGPNQEPGQQDEYAAAGSIGIMQAPVQDKQRQRGAHQQTQHPKQRNSTYPGEEVILTFFLQVRLPFIDH
jgi:hypothetical protein